MILVIRSFVVSRVSSLGRVPSGETHEQQVSKRCDGLHSRNDGGAAKVGAIDKQTMRSFDEACLTRVRPLRPRQIKAIRERQHVSQTVFANYLNVTPNLVSK